MNEESQINYYAVIPATVRYDKKLKPAEKLIYGEITSLTNRMGYCFASNKYFANLYGVTVHTISQWISHLEKLGYITIEIIRNEKKEVKERKIYINDSPYVQKNIYPYVLKSTYPMYKNVQDNNINIKIDRLFNFFINKKKGEVPEELNVKSTYDIYSNLIYFELLYPKEILEIYSESNITKLKYATYVVVEISKTERKQKLKILSRNELFGIYDRCKEKENEIVNFYDYFLASIINELDKL